MVNIQIVEYIQRQFRLGDSQEKIRNDLLANGWTSSDIDEAVASISPQDTQVAKQNLAKRSSRNTVFIIVLVVVLLMLGYGAYFIFTNNALNTGEEGVVVSGQNTVPVPETPDLLPESPDSPPAVVNDSAVPPVAPVSSSSKPGADSNIADCTDTKCFVSAIRNCSEAQYQSESKVAVLGSEIQSEIGYSLSQSGGTCLLSLKLLSYKISASQGLLDSMKGAEVVGPGPAEIYPKLNSEAQTKIVGKMGVCNITKDKDTIVDLINNKSGIYLIADPDPSICSGELFVR